MLQIGNTSELNSCSKRLQYTLVKFSLLVLDITNSPGNGFHDNKKAASSTAGLEPTPSERN